ncbi:cell wall hydrolase [Acetohalobium arabaticum]|uniref:Cell wall hydrolase SleB n=1 Tax=Acetohalobium arabaticum (strain ATCC 49924 / DSM 5501 / Z-7288) TaxID=574087 RepID=D9QR31_ACEAZ|nr:cell wall hydrolase [Acetohalobium arabaticum]ADL12972.1 cell wall hydrolase SleB [Acetohalobium arabaticum DSM 5501]
MTNKTGFSLKVVALTLIFTLLISYITVLLPLCQDNVAHASGLDIKVSSDDISKGLALILLFTVVREALEEDVNAENISDSNQGLLARIIHAEARGEPYRGQVAVGAVVLNRVRSSQFPDTIQEVVYQEGQFTSVENGQINLNPNKTAYRAAKEALSGRDPSKDALYFYNPDKARTLWWLSTRETTVEIGNHVFAE